VPVPGRCIGPRGAGLFDADPDHPGTSHARGGGFVREPAEFGAGFFGISPRGAVGMDPQQQLLEMCREALERAGINPESLRGTPAGEFAGAAGSGYGAPGQGGPAEALGHGLTAGVNFRHVLVASGM
jgi:acyl transferase domain-containing protein